MIPLSLLLLSPGLHVSILGEGRLRFAAGSTVAFATSATLAPNSAGLLGDAGGRPVLPQIRLGGPFAVAMNGTVSVAGRAVGRLVLQRPNGDIGMPGEGTFGVIQVGRQEDKGKREKGLSSSSSSPLPLASSLTRISVHPRSEIDGDRILLRDVASLSGDRDTVERLKEMDLGETPALGTRRSLTRWTIQSVLRDAGFASGSVEILLPPDTTVTRRGQTVDPKTIEDAAMQAALKESGNAELASGGFGPATVLAPTGDLTLATSTARTGERLTVTVAVVVDGRTVARRNLVFVAKETGIRAGQMVQVTIERNGAVFEVAAKAKTNGKMGDTIQIETDGGSTLTATVTGEGQVEVRL